jgi:hypothetical protein
MFNDMYRTCYLQTLRHREALKAAATQTHDKEKSEIGTKLEPSSVASTLACSAFNPHLTAYYALSIMMGIFSRKKFRCAGSDKAEIEDFSFAAERR